MNHTEKQAIQHEILGELQPLFNEYVDVVDTIPADAPAVEVPYVPAVVSDRVSAALKKLTANSSYDEFTAAIIAKGHSLIPDLWVQSQSCLILLLASMKLQMMLKPLIS